MALGIVEGKASATYPGAGVVNVSRLDCGVFVPSNRVPTTVTSYCKWKKHRKHRPRHPNVNSDRRHATCNSPTVHHLLVQELGDVASSVSTLCNGHEMRYPSTCLCGRLQPEQPHFRVGTGDYHRSAAAGRSGGESVLQGIYNMTTNQVRTSNICTTNTCQRDSACAKNDWF